MTEFLLALAAFLAAHVVPARPQLRAALVDRLGERTYLVVYSVVSLGLLVWLVSAGWRAPYVEVWPPAGWAAWVAVLAMPLALALIGAGVACRNPLSVGFVRSHGEMDGVVRVTRHPLLWGFALWAFAHLPANGDVVAILLFGGLGTFALAGMAVLDRRRRRSLGEARWQALAAGTSALPFAALLAGRTDGPVLDGRTLAGAAAGLAVYAALLSGGHAALFGVDPLAWLL